MTFEEFQTNLDSQIKITFLSSKRYIETRGTSISYLKLNLKERLFFRKIGPSGITDNAIQWIKGTSNHRIDGPATIWKNRPKKKFTWSFNSYHYYTEDEYWNK